MSWRSVLGLTISVFLIIGVLGWILGMPTPARLVGSGSGTIVTGPPLSTTALGDVR